MTNSSESIQRLNSAFEQLSNAGYTAKQDFGCCQSCAWNALTDKESEKAVFYHAQDKEDLDKTGKFYVAWSGDGNFICETFNSNGIKTEWNGCGSSRIKVILS